MEKLHCPVEVRESASGPMLHGVLIQEGERPAFALKYSRRAPWFGKAPELQSEPSTWALKIRGRFQHAKRTAK